nr:hypothetical protein [Psychrobacter sp. PraFG1]UNK06073.1 hypothetical protein MN210_05165 [Psychrobacter sp. PraFG1]
MGAWVHDFRGICFLSLQRRLNLVGQKIAREAFAETSFGNITTTAKSVITIALSVELLGFIALSIAFVQEMPLSDALYHGFFIPSQRLIMQALHLLVIT